MPRIRSTATAVENTNTIENIVNNTVLDLMPETIITPEERDEEESTFTCDNCSNTCNTDEEEIINSQSVCRSCYEEYYRSCDNCSNQFNADENNYEVVGDTLYCENCSDNYLFSCEGCGEYDHNDNGYTAPNDNVYCQECFYQRCTTCHDCDEDYERDDCSSCDECGYSFCENCYSEHGHTDPNLTPEQLAEITRQREEERARRQAEEARLIAEASRRNPWRKPSEDFTKGDRLGEIITIDRFVGVEIEAEKGEILDLGTAVSEKVGISTDGSLTNKGVELQIPPSSLNKLEEIIKETCDALQEHKFKGTKSAGLHIHVDARDIRKNHKKITQIIKTYYSIEDMLFSMLPPSRWASTFCKRLAQDYLYSNFRKEDEDVQKKWYKETDDHNCKSRAIRKYDSSRYYGLNIHSLFFRGTIELRYHSGTVNPVKIQQWIQLNLLIIDWIINNYNEKTIQKFFELETGHEKLDFFIDVFNIGYGLRNYIKSRVSKFNPNFFIKFNKGKKVRTNERKYLSKKKKEMEDKINKKVEDLLKKQKEQVRQGVKIGYYDSVEQINWNSIRQEFYITTKNDMISRLTPEEFEAINMDGGFMPPSAVKKFQEFLETGRSLERANSVEGEIDEE